MNGQIYFPPFKGINRLIILVALGCFLLESIGRVFLSSHLPFLGLSGRWFFQGHLYELFTFALFPNGPLELIFDGLLLWFVGSELEELWGRKKYIQYLIFCTWVAGLFYVLLSLLFVSFHPVPLRGLAGLCNGLLVAYAMLYPNRPFSFFMLFPVPAKYFCAILIALQTYQGLFTPGAARAIGHLIPVITGPLFLWLSVKIKNARPLGQRSKSSGHNLRLVKDSSEENDQDDQKPKIWH